MKPFGLVVEVSPRQNQQSSFGESVPFATIAPDRSAGWTLSEKNGVVVIKSVEDESPAANAGMGIDDEIIAINGYRVTSVGMVQQLLALLGDNTVEVVAQSDGRLYQTTLTTPTETKVTIRFAEDLSSQQQHLSSVWLRQ